MESPVKSPRTTRRKFLIGGAAATGLLIGYAVWPRNRPLNLVAREGEQIINGWLKLGIDGQITVMVPQAEMGQGVYTSLPQILADELGADWRTVGVEPAPLHPIYANTAMAMAASKAAPDMLRDVVRWAAVEVTRRLDLQLTGGSTSIAGFYDTMRLAGASARELLCKAAAREWGVDWEQCDTVDGFVVYQANRVRFAEIAVKAADEDASDKPKLRDRPRLIGTSVTRLDIPSKTNGSARFGADVRIPGMAYAAIKGGPVHGGALKTAKAPPGTKIVRGPTWVAAVADTWWGAKTALDGVTATWDAAPRPAGPWMDKALTDALTGDGVKAFREDGDVDAALTGNVVQADYGVPFLAHACMEPMNATARILDGRAEVWAPTQSTTLVNWAVAKALDINEQDVTVFPTLLGGGFGRKAEVDVCVQAALIARDAGRPVQLIWSREEDMAHDMYRPPAKARMRAKLSPDKRIAALDCTIAVPAAGASFFGRNMPSMAPSPGKPDSQSLGGAKDAPYAIPNLRVSHAPVELPVPIGFWRSVEHSYTGFFIESFIDELAIAANVDPLTFRLRMLEEKPRHAEVLKVAASRGGYMGSGDGISRGIALHESFGTIVAQVAEVEVKRGVITVKRVTCAVDCGVVVNPDIVRQQMEGGIIFGLTAALKGEITFADGEAEQRNFDGYPLLTMAETPEIEVIIIASPEPPTGCGEPGTPPIAPAVANAIFAATGKRLRSLPFKL